MAPRDLLHGPVSILSFGDRSLAVEERLLNSSRFDSVLRQALVLPVLALLLAALLLLIQMHAANLTVTQMQSADRAVEEVIQIERLMDDEETGLRGYQTTGDARFLDPYHAAQTQMNGAFNRLRALTERAGVEAADSVTQDQDRQIDELEAACDDWRARFAEPLIATMAAGGSTRDVGINLQGKAIFDGMRSRIDRLSRSLAVEREDEISHWQQQTHRMTIALLVLALMLGLLIGLYIRRRLHEVSTAFHHSAESLRAHTEQIYRSEQKLRTTLDSIGDGVITCDADGLVEGMNAVAQELTGWPLAEARGQKIEDVFKILDESTREPLENPVAKVKRLDRIVGLANHTVLVRRDGSEIAIDDSGAPIRSEGGALTGVVMVFRDVTHARRSQAALLVNEKLATAGRLAATIAHEIHNPLDSVSNLLFLMDGQSTPEETTHFLALARQEIARVTQISRAMLSLYRESKAPVAIDVKEMLDSLLLLMARRLADLNVEVQADLPEGLIIHGFPAELRQVFTNLLTNAAEACSPRSEGYQAWQAANPELAAAAEQPPLITVTAQQCLAGLDQDGLRREAGVEVLIADEGPGIPADVAERLFQPFFTTKGERGTGLGLWVSRGIMTKHGGSVHFEDRTGEGEHGTIFSVYMAPTPGSNAGGD